MKRNIRHIDPDLPEEIAAKFPLINAAEDFQLPENYFDQLQSRVLAKVSEISEKHPEATESYFESAADQVLTLARLEMKLGKSTSEEFVTPNGYFESLPLRIDAKKGRGKAKIISLPSARTWRRVFIPAAAAAAIIAVIFIAWPEQNPIVTADKFESLLAATDISEDDLEYFATEEDLYSLYLDEVEEFMADTIVEPKVEKKEAIAPPVKKEQKPVAKNPNAKEKKAEPKKDKTEINFDELTEDEILEYLLMYGDETDDL